MITEVHIIPGLEMTRDWGRVTRATGSVRNSVCSQRNAPAIVSGGVSKEAWIPRSRVKPEYADHFIDDSD